jgi:hypothetical protein
VSVWRVGGLVVVLALSAGCVTARSSGPAWIEFEDIPIPSVLTYLEDKAVIIESPGVKAARLLYRGRVSVATLAPALRSGLETNGWKSVSSTTTPPQGTVQIYEKDRSALQLRLWEDIFFTYVELTTSRLTPAASGIPAAAATPAAENR